MCKLYFPKNVIIPGVVAQNPKIPGEAKVFYGILNGLAHVNGFAYGSTKEFAELADKDERTILRWLDILEEQTDLSRDTKMIFHGNNKKEDYHWKKERKIYIGNGDKIDISERDKNVMTRERDKNVMTRERDKNVTYKYKDININNNTNCPPSKKADGKKKFSKNVIEITKTFYQSILSWKGKLSKNQDYKKWEAHIDKMIRIDGRTKDQILTVISWLANGADNDSLFWRSNILSGDKLRQQFDTIEARMLSTAKPTVQHSDDFKTKVKNFFKDGSIHIGATCNWNETAIGFSRGMKHEQVYWNDYSFKDNFVKMLRSFGIPISEPTTKKVASSNNMVGNLLAPLANNMRLNCATR